MNDDHIAKAAEAVVRQQEGRALSFDDVTEIAAARDEIAKAQGKGGKPASFKETDHPRNHGKFAPKAGGGAASQPAKPLGTYKPFSSIMGDAPVKPKSNEHIPSHKPAGGTGQQAMLFSDLMAAHKNKAPLPAPKPAEKPKAAAPTDPKQWADASKTAIFEPSKPATGALNGVAFKPWAAPRDADGWNSVEGQNHSIKEPPMPKKEGKRTAAGVIIREPDGRIWVISPTNEYGGYRNSFPKGGKEDDIPSLQANAIKEAWEESGLKVKITGHLGDFERDTSIARYYTAERVGGTPTDHHWESWNTKLAPIEHLDGLLNRNTDKPILAAIKSKFGVKKAILFCEAAGIEEPVEKAKGKKAAGPAHPGAPTHHMAPGQYKASLHPRDSDGHYIQTADKVEEHKPKAKKTQLPKGPAEFKLDDGGFQTAVPYHKWNQENGAAQSAMKSLHAYKKLADATDVAGLEAVKPSDPGKGGNAYTQGKWKAWNEALEHAKKAPVEEAKADRILKFDTKTWDKVGTQKGSNEAGVYKAPDGEHYYVKFVQSNEHAANEIVAAKLMKAAGLPTLDYHEIDLGNGKRGVATKWAKKDELFDHDNPVHVADAQKNFGANAWLANWDVIGTGANKSESMNQAIVNGKMTTMDVGGSLLFRAQGGPKGEMFGKEVGEFNTLRASQPNPLNGKVFGTMTPQAIKDSVAHVSKLSDATIHDLVKRYGPGDEAAKTALADKLVARKYDLIQKANALAGDPVTTDKGADVAIPPKPKAAPAAAVPKPAAQDGFSEKAKLSIQDVNNAIPSHLNNKLMNLQPHLIDEASQLDEAAQAGHWTKIIDHQPSHPAVSDLKLALMGAMAKKDPEGAQQHGVLSTAELQSATASKPKVSAPPEKPTGQLPGVQAALDSLHALGKDEHKGAKHKLNTLQAAINNTHSATVKQFAQQWHDHLSATGGATGAAPVQAAKPAAAVAVQGGPQKPTGLQFGQYKVDLVHAIGTDPTTSVETKLKLLNDAKAFSVLGPVTNHAQSWIDHYGAGGTQPAPSAAPELPAKPAWTVGKKGDKTKFYDDQYAQAAAMAQQGDHAGIAALYSPSAPMSANQKQWTDVKAKLIEHGKAVAAPKAAAALAATVPAASPAPAATTAPVKPTGLGKQTQSEVDYVHDYATGDLLHATKVKELQGVVSEPWTDEAKAHAQAWLDHWNAAPAKQAQASVSAPPTKPTGLLPGAQLDVNDVHDTVLNSKWSAKSKMDWLHDVQRSEAYGPEAKVHAKAWEDHLKATGGATSTTAPATDIGSASMPVAAPAAAMAHGPAVGTPKPEKYVIVSKSNVSSQKHFDTIHAKGESGDKAWMLAKVEELTTKVAGGKANSYVVAQLKKANEWMAHFQTGGQTATTPGSQAKHEAQPAAPKLDASKLTPPPDFFQAGSQGATGKWVSSKQEINEANNAEVQHIAALAQKSDLEAIKAYKPTSPSSHVASYLQQVKEDVNLQLNPPKAAKAITILDDARYREAIAAIDAQTPPLTHPDQLQSKSGFYPVLGHVDNPMSLMPPTTHKENDGTLTPQTYAAQSYNKIDNLNSVEQSAMHYYTTSNGASEINESYRSGSPSIPAKQANAGIKDSMVDLDVGTVISRKIAMSSQQRDDFLQNAVGKVVQEFGISSTSISPRTWDGNVHLRMHVGPDVQGVYVGAGGKISKGSRAGKALSQFPSELEILLPANCRMVVMQVHPAGPQKDGFGHSDMPVVDVLILPNKPSWKKKTT